MPALPSHLATAREWTECGDGIVSADQVRAAMAQLSAARAALSACGMYLDPRAVEKIETHAAHVLAACAAEEVAPPAPRVPSYDEEDYWELRATIKNYCDSKERT